MPASTLPRVWSKPVFFAFRLLGNEVLSVEFGPSQVPDDDKPRLEGGPGGLQDMGFVYREDLVVAREQR